jgi:hypothetical protein
MIRVIPAFIFLLLLPALAPAQPGEWAGFPEGSVISPLDGCVNKFHYYKTTSPEKQPLVISLHQWSADYAHFANSLAPQTKNKNWNYIHPDVRGPNNHPKAAGSDYVISDIDHVIDWAVKNLHADESRIYIVGASGGGYTALCHFMKSRSPHRIKEYSVWVPITDLDRWYHESLARKSRYANDIIRCVSRDGKTYSVEEARARSPLFMTTPKEKPASAKLKIHVGIHDGYSGAVPIIHSIAFYNKLVRDTGGAGEALISDEEAIWMLTTRTAWPGRKADRKIGGRAVHCHRSHENISLVIFEGGHEILTDAVLE